MTAETSESDLKLGLSLLSRDDLEDALLKQRRSNQALRERMLYWKERCELAERALPP